MYILSLLLRKYPDLQSSGLIGLLKINKYITDALKRISLKLCKVHILESNAPHPCEPFRCWSKGQRSILSPQLRIVIRIETARDKCQKFRLSTFPISYRNKSTKRIFKFCKYQDLITQTNSIWFSLSKCVLISQIHTTRSCNHIYID